MSYGGSVFGEFENARMRMVRSTSRSTVFCLVRVGLSALFLTIIVCPPLLRSPPDRYALLVLAQISEYIKSTVHSANALVGTCKMGEESDNMSVVDSSLKVNESKERKERRV